MEGPAEIEMEIRWLVEVGEKGRRRKGRRTYGELLDDGLSTLHLRALEGEHGVAALVCRCQSQDGTGRRGKTMSGSRRGRSGNVGRFVQQGVFEKRVESKKNKRQHFWQPYPNQDPHPDKKKRR